MSHADSHQSDALVPIIYESPQPVLFSPLAARKMGLSLQYEPWQPNVIQISNDGSLVYRSDPGQPIKGTFTLSVVNITQLDHTIVDGNAVEEGSSRHSDNKKETGICVKCHTGDGYASSFRCIMSADDLFSFYEAVKRVSTMNNLVSDNLDIRPQHKHNVFRDSHYNQSVMRKTIAQAMDYHDMREKKVRIRAKRGAMPWLPVLFANDLVHGSWWFVLGSVLFVISSLAVFFNSFGGDLGSDDSTLTPDKFRGAWFMMILSGIFASLGSMAFVRAVHADPPMQPLLTGWYHFQNDELLGSWCFLFATVPFIPYSIIYLSDDDENIIYLGMLFFSIVLTIGTYLFVRACYPQETGTAERMKIIQPLATCMCWCFCSKRWLRRHLSNDWLAGTWLIFWCTLVSCIGCFVVTGAAVARHKILLGFILATGFIENLCFLIGAAYFVAGSYPDGEVLLDDVDVDDDDDDDLGRGGRGNAASTGSGNNPSTGTRSEMKAVVAGTGSDEEEHLSEKDGLPSSSQNNNIAGGGTFAGKIANGDHTVANSKINKEKSKKKNGSSILRNSNGGGGSVEEDAADGLRTPFISSSS